MDLYVRFLESLDSSTAQPGDNFEGALERPIISDGATLYPKGSAITGRVVVVRSGGVTRPGILELDVISVRYGSQESLLTTEPFKIKGESHTSSKNTRVGGAAAGAIIGAIAGGGKGAAVGAGVGTTGKQEAKVESEAVLVFVTSAPSTAPTTSSGAATSRSAASTSSSGVKSYDDDDPAAQSFSAPDRRVIRTCLQDPGKERHPASGIAEARAAPARGLRERAAPSAA